MTRSPLLPIARRPLAALVGAACSVALLAGSGASTAADDAAAAAAKTNPAGWARYHSEGFSAPAGDPCPFAIRSKVLFDREYVRTTDRFADGDPKREEYVGPLVVRVTNLESGRSVVRDLSARAVVTYTADGGYDFAIQGPAAVGFHPGDGLATGFYVLRGRHTVRFAADGTRTVVADHGREENLCATLD